MKLVCISDTHELFPENISNGDILIHAGDFTFRGDFFAVRDFRDWLNKQKFSHTIVIAGNHELTFESNKEIKNLIRNNYLEDSGITINGIKFWGSPWTPRFHDWAFNVDRGEAIKKKWDKIPIDTDVLITHGPPLGILDYGLGCEELLKAVQRIKPKVHIFGHIHSGYGILKRDGTTFINAALCNDSYKLINRPIVLDITPKELSRDNS